MKHDKVFVTEKGWRKPKLFRADLRWPAGVFIEDRQDLLKQMLPDIHKTMITFTSVIAMKPHKEYTKKTQEIQQKTKKERKKSKLTSGHRPTQNKKEMINVWN